MWFGSNLGCSMLNICFFDTKTRSLKNNNGFQEFVKLKWKRKEKKQWWNWHNKWEIFCSLFFLIFFFFWFYFFGWIKPPKLHVRMCFFRFTSVKLKTFSGRYKRVCYCFGKSIVHAAFVFPWWLLQFMLWLLFVLKGSIDLFGFCYSVKVAAFQRLWRDTFQFSNRFGLILVERCILWSKRSHQESNLSWAALKLFYIATRSLESYNYQN